VKLFNGLRTKIGQYTLKKTSVGSCQRQFLNWSEIHRIQIVFNRIGQKQADEMVKFVKFLLEEGKKVDVLIFVDAKKLDETFQNRPGITYYCRKDLNWFGKPTSIAVEEFLSRDADLLIVPEFTDIFHFTWIATLSKAKSVVAPYSDWNTWATMLLKIEGKDINSFLQQAIHYLGFINQK